MHAQHCPCPKKDDFDILDAIRLWLEKSLSLQRVGKMKLDRNPNNDFAGTEEVAFNTTNVVPGVEA